MCLAVGLCVGLVLGLCLVPFMPFAHYFCDLFEVLCCVYSDCLGLFD